MVARGNQFRDTIAHTNALTSSNMMGLVKQVGGAVADVGNGWAKSLDSPGFKHFLDVMAKSLPDQIKGLGHIFDRVVAASVITFIAMQPWSPRSSAGLTMSSASTAWTGSDKGQTKMLASLSRPVPWRLLAGSLKRWVALQGPPL